MRQPGVAFMSISEYNDTFDQCVEENNYLEQQIRLARQQMGPNDVLVHNFIYEQKSVEEEEEEMDLDQVLEDEYEEECSHDKDCDCSEFAEEVNAFEVDDAQTRNHLVAFRVEGLETVDCLMKGKTRYMQKLKDYVNGDDSVEVRMYNGSKMKVADLAPNKESLQRLFEAFPSGPHIVSCD